MFSYRAIVKNIHLLQITPDLQKLKRLIMDSQIGVDDSAPTKRRYTFQDVELILSAKDRYAI